jgi:TolB-like protein
MSSRAVACLFLWSLAAGAQVPDAGAAAPPAARDDELPRLVVTDLVAQGASPQQAAALTDAVVAALSARKLFQVVSSRDIQSLLGAERQKQLSGACAESPDACATDVSAALAGRFLLSGQLSRVGSAFQLTLQMIDSSKGQPVGRSTRIANDLEALRALVPYAAAEATGSPLPPPPSRVLSVSLLAGGGGTVFAGGVVGLLALSKQQTFNDELCPTGVVPGQRCTGENLNPRDFYIQKDGELATQRAIALGLLVGGAAIAGLGFWLMPPADTAGAAAMVVPQPIGLAVVGVFP